jgi:hypothetical protein
VLVAVAEPAQADVLQEVVAVVVLAQMVLLAVTLGEQELLHALVPAVVVVVAHYYLEAALY